MLEKLPRFDSISQGPDLQQLFRCSRIEIGKVIFEMNSFAKKIALPVDQIHRLASLYKNVAQAYLQSRSSEEYQAKESTEKLRSSWIKLHVELWGLCVFRDLQTAANVFQGWVFVASPYDRASQSFGRDKPAPEVPDQYAEFRALREQESDQIRTVLNKLSVVYGGFGMDWLFKAKCSVWQMSWHPRFRDSWAPDNVDDED